MFSGRGSCRRCTIEYECNNTIKDALDCVKEQNQQLLIFYSTSDGRTAV